MGEILKGLRCYFDKALVAMLLYKNEREQYQEAVSDKVSPSSVYGAEHLLRLFGTLSLSPVISVSPWLLYLFLLPSLSSFSTSLPHFSLFCLPVSLSSFITSESLLPRSLSLPSYISTSLTVLS